MFRNAHALNQYLGTCASKTAIDVFPYNIFENLGCGIEDNFPNQALVLGVKQLSKNQVSYQGIHPVTYQARFKAMYQMIHPVTSKASLQYMYQARHPVT